MDNATVAMTPLLYGWLINCLQNPNLEHVRYALMYAVGYMVLKIIEWMFHGPGRVMEHHLAFQISRNFLADLNHRVLHMPLKWQQENHSGAIINRIQKSYRALRDFLEYNSVCTAALTKFLFAVIAIVIYSPLFGSICVVLGIFSVWITTNLDKPYVASVKAVNEREHLVNSALFDSVSNINTVVTLRLQTRMEQHLFKKISDIHSHFMRGIRIFELKWGIADILVSVIYLVILVGYIFQNWQPGQPFMIGGLVALLGFVMQFTGVFQSIAGYYGMVLKYKTDVQTSDNILEGYDLQALPHRAEFKKDWASISVSDLNFTYQQENRKEQISGVHGMSFKIEKGKRIALIGRSGSGKTTLMALLRGLHEPDSPNTLLVDNGDHMPLQTLASEVTLFPQEPEIFENTIEYNITLGLPTDQQLLIDACEAAQFMDVVRRLPSGFQSKINEKGVNLSGGEKQRLALARGIVAAENSTVILMDEPTSSVDSETEIRIYRSLFQKFRNKSIISSLHRLYLLRNFDYVYILDRGRIVDHGTYGRLKSESSVFQELYRHQEATIQPA
jgi:ABC-type multidrug transport system fused ATPase/permease subunit